jgi:hypothetical protein
LAVVHFINDNPYGNPKEIMAKALSLGTEQVRVLVYGLATSAASDVFPKFDERQHCMEASAIEGVKGTNYHLMDPAGDRNFAQLWMRATEEHDYGYREWPGNYWIPRIGVPEPWAIPSGAKNGINDGARGRGQMNFGFGLLRYKFEIARLEGWEDFARWRRDAAFTGTEAERDRAVLNGVLYPEDRDLEDWWEGNGAREAIERRIIDSRAASNPRVEKDRPVTLQTELADIGLQFDLAPGIGVDDGIAKINSALDFDENEDGSFWNKARLVIGKNLVNTIYALQYWMNADGEHGATKDFVDLLRYFYGAVCTYVGETRGSVRVAGAGALQARGGGRPGGLPGPSRVSGGMGGVRRVRIRV